MFTRADQDQLSLLKSRGASSRAARKASASSQNATPPRRAFSPSSSSSSTRPEHPVHMGLPEMAQSISPSRSRVSRKAAANVTPRAAPVSTISVNDIREDQEIEEAWNRYQAQARTSDSKAAALSRSPAATTPLRSRPVSATTQPSQSNGRASALTVSAEQRQLKKMQREAYERSIAEQERKRSKAQEAYNRSVAEQQQQREMQQAADLLARKKQEDASNHKKRVEEALRLKAEEDAWLQQQQAEADAMTSDSSTDEHGEDRMQEEVEAISPRPRPKSSNVNDSDDDE
jgi:hypothetical protein